MSVVEELFARDHPYPRRFRRLNKEHLSILTPHAERDRKLEEEHPVGAFYHRIPDGSFIHEWEEHLYEWPGSWYHNFAYFQRHIDCTYSYRPDYRFAPDYASSIPTLIKELSKRLHMSITPGDSDDYYKAMEKMRSLASDGLVLFTEPGLFEEAVALTAEYLRRPHERVYVSRDHDGFLIPEVKSGENDPGFGLLTECYIEMIEDRIPFDFRDDDTADLVSWEDVAGGG
ncbi:MAG: hypothetical protein AAGA56_09010 [Myxococcota bacterium]